MENKLLKIPGVPDFLKFILDEDKKLLHDPKRKHRETFSYNPMEIEKKMGLTPQQQLKMMRYLKNNYDKCVRYDEKKFSGNDWDIVDANLDKFLRYTKNEKLKAIKALERIKYESITVTVFDDYEQVYNKIFALDEVVFKVSIKICSTSSTDDCVSDDAPISLCINDRKIYTTRTADSNTKYVLDLAFNDEEKLKNGLVVRVDRKMNLSDVLLSTVKRNGILKKLIYDNIKGNSFEVYPEITNRILEAKGLSKADVEDIINTI